MPAVTFCTDAFRTLVQLRLRALRMPALPVIFLPHPFMTNTPAALERLAEQHIEEIVRMLTDSERQP